MGQARRIPHLWRCIILIGTAIQGITPAPAELAHPKLLRMISPILGSDFESPGEGQSVVEVCEPLRTEKCSQIRQLADTIELTGQIPSGIRPEFLPFDAHALASHRNEELRTHGLMPPHDRLRC